MSLLQDTTEILVVKNIIQVLLQTIAQILPELFIVSGWSTAQILLVAGNNLMSKFDNLQKRNKNQEPSFSALASVDLRARTNPAPAPGHRPMDLQSLPRHRPPLRSSLWAQVNYPLLTWLLKEVGIFGRVQGEEKKEIKRKKEEGERQTYEAFSLLLPCRGIGNIPHHALLNTFP